MKRLLILIPALILTACAKPQSTLYGQGPAAEKIARMSWLMLILFLLITVVMWVLIVWAFSRRRGSLNEHAPVDEGGGQGWISWGGLGFPIIVLTILFVLGLRLMSSFPVGGKHLHDIQPTIVIIGHQWWWEVQYNGLPAETFTTANEIHIPVSQPIDIELTSSDVIHSFWVPALHGKVDLVPDHPNYIRIQADQPGTYMGTCAEYCGAQHAHMRLLVVAEAPSDYRAWKEQQLKPAADPATEDAKRGEEDFMGAACSMCHQVRGTLAGGRVAPDLTHIGSRQYIAANSYNNNDAYLEAWITHAQSLKPDSAMPNLTQFNGQQLRDIVAYLRQLQ